jgi:hypothetical protein
MWMKVVDEGGERWELVSYCGVGSYLIFPFSRHLGKYIFPFPLSLLFGGTLPIHSAGESRNVKICFLQDGSKMKRQKNVKHRSPRALLNNFPTLLSSRWSLPLRPVKKKVFCE